MSDGAPHIEDMLRHIRDLSQALREAKRWNHVLRRERDDFERLYKAAVKDVAPWNTPDQKALMESIYEATKKPQENQSCVT